MNTKDSYYMVALAWFMTLVISFLMVACGADKKEESSDKDNSPTTQINNQKPSSTVTDKEESSVPADDLPVAEKPKTFTKDQALRMMIRASFDQKYRDGKVFEVPALMYVVKADHGTMGWPDVTYVPQAKDVSMTCPLGFKIADKISLSISIGKGLLDKLAPDTTWIWTSDKAGTQGIEYYAYSVEDQTDAWGFNFMGGLFYSAHRNRKDAQVYCVMDVRDLPNVDDIPAEVQSSF